VGGVPEAGEEGAGSRMPKVLELYNTLQPKKHKEVGVNRSITTGTRIKSWKFKPLFPPSPHDSRFLTPTGAYKGYMYVDPGVHTCTWKTYVYSLIY